MEREQEKPETIKVVHKRVGERPKVVEIKYNLQEMQRLVEGYISVVIFDDVFAGPHHDNIIMYLNDEGTFDKQPNLRCEKSRLLLENNCIYGDVFVCGKNGGDDRSLTQKEIDYVMPLLEEYSISYRNRTT